NLGRQKLRTALAAVGMMVGVWLVVIFSAISAGALQTVESMLTAFGEDFHCYKADVADMALSILPEKEIREKLEAVEGVAEITAAAGWFASTPDAELIIYVIGLRPGEFALAKLLENGDALVHGEAGFSGTDVHEAIVGTLRLKQLEKEVGDTLTLQGVEFRIVGQFTRGMTLYDNAVLIPLDTLSKEFRGGKDTVSFFSVRVTDKERTTEIAEAVEERIPELATVATLEEVKKVDKGLEKMETVSAVILVAAVFIGFLFVMLAMIMVIFERIREIGILRAVGWRRRQIVFAVLVESLLLSMIGVVAGIPTGLLGVELISQVTDLNSFLAPVYEPEMYIRVVVVAVAAAGIGGIYPAWRASRMHPAEAIRYE
ncbi:MAG: FtsX-like permease family protein, partial [Planctomycetota bacterium]